MTCIFQTLWITVAQGETNQTVSTLVQQLHLYLLELVLLSQNNGNRSISSKTGSADVLEELGVSLTMTKEHTEAMLKENKISFLFAPHVHTKLRPFMKVRTTLGL